MRVGIAGAGLMGQLMAFHLVNAGCDVVIFDPAFDKNCSSSAAGLLTPVAELEKNEVIIYHMGMSAILRAWPNILSQLQNEIYFKHDGSLMIAHTRDRIELQRLMMNIMTKQFDHSAVKHISHEAIVALEPDLDKFADGYYCEGEAQIDNQHLLTELGEYLLKRNVRFRRHKVTNIARRCIDVDGIKEHFDLTIDCRGVGAKDQFVSLRGVRGELLWLHVPGVHISRPVRLYHPRYSLYLVPRPGNNYLIGASEIEAEDYSPISLQTSLELMSAVYSIHSGFAEARLIKTVTHCRPTLIHHRPSIKYSEGLIAINGLYRHGFLIAPVLAEEVMHYLNNGEKAKRYPQIWEVA